MVMMAIAEIIAEIDSYLCRLLQARELLSNRTTESPQKSAPPRIGKVTNRQAGPYTSNTRRAGENKSRSNHPVAHRKRTTKVIDTGANVPNTATPGAVGIHVSSSEQTAVAQPERGTEQSIVVTRIPARRRNSLIRSVRHRTAKPDTKPNAIKPAIALAGPVRAKIVVVSAEQIQREREQAPRSEVPRPPTRTSGLGGRRAFEALFPD
jgi:hypothetical protein